MTQTPNVESDGAALDGLRVTKRIDGAHPLHADYPLLPGDLLVRDADGTFTKEAPGLAVIGFMLREEDVVALEPVRFRCAGLSYYVLPPGESNA